MISSSLTIQPIPPRAFENRRGFIAGCFDIIHPGYISMFKDAKTVCDHLVVGLQSDPTLDRPEKNKPILPLEERYYILDSLKYVDEIKLYDTERDLYKFLKTADIHVRILGSDYKNKPYNGDDLGIDVYFHQRNHDWSSTNLKKLIAQSFIK